MTIVVTKNVYDSENRGINSNRNNNGNGNDYSNGNNNIDSENHCAYEINQIKHSHN